VIFFVVFAAVVQVFILLPFTRPITFETLPYLGIPIVQAFAFGIVGHIVSRLVAIQRQQRNQLMQANQQLAWHANTLEQLTISRERNRLARELHDTLAHTLSGLAVNLEAIKITLDEGEIQEAHTLVDHALDNTRRGLTDTRRAIKALRPKHLKDLGLELAITNLAENAASRAGFTLNLQIGSPIPDLTPDVEQCFYRVAQEALENIIRHAEAQQVDVQLHPTEHQFELFIQDDGTGFDPSDVDTRERLGLRGMHERASGVGAHLEVNSQPQGGTAIRLSVENPQ
jgi:signal transduction histidine kinase